MNVDFKSPIALAVAVAISTGALVAAPSVVAAAGKTPGKYVAGDFHNHTTCSDGSISMEKLIKKATDKVDTPWGLDWFVQAGHGGNGFRNCTLVEDATLDSPAYPFVTGKGPTTSWEQSGVTIKGDLSNDASGARNMWRWQSIQEFQYPLVEYFNHYRNLPLFTGIESVVPGHEHSSMSVITSQIPAALDTTPLPTGPGYTPVGSGTRSPSGNIALTAPIRTRVVAPPTIGTARSPGARTRPIPSGMPPRRSSFSLRARATARPATTRPSSR